MNKALYSLTLYEVKPLIKGKQMTSDLVKSLWENTPETIKNEHKARLQERSTWPPVDSVFETATYLAMDAGCVAEQVFKKLHPKPRMGKSLKRATIVTDWYVAKEAAYNDGVEKFWYDTLMEFFSEEVK